ncbi:MAG: T9SS C-terminal target domain-containing protein [Candidatus Hydrogenedentota bacterium]|nr:MAG: T9SS C-terminal target domain-containing protein [Candidatus Hydrogenedentota bacterium]
MVTLTEDGLSSPRFVSKGIFLSDTRGSGPGDGILTAGFGDSIVARYDTDASLDTVFVSEVPSTGTIAIATPLTAPDSVLVVTVVDSDMNRAPFVGDTLNVILTSLLGADTETVVLTETADSSGQFTFAGIAVSDTRGGTAEDGILLIGIGDTVRALYADPYGVADSAETSVPTVRRATPSLLLLNQATYTPSETVSITLSDPDRNRRPRLAETVTVILRDPTTTDSETVLLTETGETSGIFTGLLPLIKVGLPTNGDGNLLVQVGDEIRAEYTDAYDGSETALDTATIVPDPTPSAISLNAETYVVADRLVITVIDLDQNLLALAVETVAVTVFVPGTGDTETVVLTETAAATGGFTNAAGLRLSDTRGANLEDGILMIGAGDTFSVTYRDPDAPSDSATVAGTFVMTFSTSALSFEKAIYAPGDSVVAVLTDPNANVDPRSPDTVSVTIIDAARGDTETVELTETTDTSGVFRNVVGLSFEVSDTPGVEDGVIQARLGETLTVTYRDLFDAADLALDTAVLELSSPIALLHVDATPFTDTTLFLVTFLDRFGDTIPDLELLVPVRLLSFTGGTGDFTSRSETIVSGFARFVYNKVEDAELRMVFEVSAETFVAGVILSTGADSRLLVANQPENGTIGMLIAPASLFPDTAKITVENFNALSDTPALPPLIAIANNELGDVRNLTSLSTATNEQVRSEHQFLVRIGGQEQHSLKRSIEVRITYPDADQDGIVDGTKIREQNLQIYRLDEDLGRWNVEPGSVVDPVNNWVTVEVDHLTIFSIAGGAAVNDLNSVTVYPNPFEPNSAAGHQYVTFANLPSGTRVRIYTGDGRLVDEAFVAAGANTVRWDGRNAAGRAVASGVYVYVLENGAERRVGKLVVIR